jgi:alpha-L-rhamnosidase
MFGDISAWMFTYLAGIRPVESAPGFQRFTIAPRTVAGLDWVEAEHESPYGTVKSSWGREVGGITLRVMVPGNSRAEIVAPAGMEIRGSTELGEGEHEIWLAAVS